jgi:hypothetical protein
MPLTPGRRGGGWREAVTNLSVASGSGEAHPGRFCRASVALAVRGYCLNDLQVVVATLSATVCGVGGRQKTFVFKASCCLRRRRCL